MKPSLVKEFCEFLGVTFLCFIAVGISVLGKSPSPAEASLVAGTAIALIIYGVGTISGAHVNPAVSLGFLVSGRFSNSQFFRYVAAQVLGSIAAFLALLALLALSGQNYNWAAAAPKIASPAAFCVETFLTGSLVFTIFSVATGDCRICPETRPLAGMVVGSAVALLSFFGGALGVGVLNPVVPFLFAIAANRWLEALLFVAATSLGAIAAALVYGMTRAPFLAPTIADTAAETTPAE